MFNAKLVVAVNRREYPEIKVADSSVGLSSTSSVVLVDSVITSSVVLVESVGAGVVVCAASSVVLVESVIISSVVLVESVGAGVVVCAACMIRGRETSVSLLPLLLPEE
jgi:hypothetical protein